LDNNNQERSLERLREYPLARPIDYERYGEEEVHLRDYWRVILRRRWTIITFFLVVVTTVTLASFLMRPLYKAKAIIQIDKESPNILYFKDVYAVERAEQDYYTTQYKILQSRNLAKKVIKSLNLDKNLEFTGDQTKTLLMMIKDWSKGLFTTTQKDKEKEEDIKPGLIDSFLSRLEITPVRGSRLVTVSYSTYEPELSAKIANTIAKSFIDFNLDSKIDATQQARDWLEKQLESLRARVEVSEEKLNKYARENNIIGIDEKQNIVTQRLTELSTAMNQATAERINKESLYRESEGEIDSNPFVLSNPLIQRLTNEYATLEAEYSQLSKLYKPGYPKMVRLEEQINRLKSTIEKEKRKIIKGIRSEYEAALKRENYLNTALNKQKAEVLTLNEKAIQYNILKREADTNKELYNGLLQRLKETGVSAGITMSNIQILDRAEVPEGPDKPKKRLNIFLAVMVGLFGGTGLAFFMEYLDNTVKTHEDIEQHIRLPFLGLIPYHPSSRYKGNPKPSPSKEIVTFEDSKSWISEAYRTVRTSILFASSGKPPKVIVFTSTRLGEGKTTTALNTALTLIQTGSKVLLIDGDMRRTRLHSILNINNSKGLSSYLSGQQGIETLQIKLRFPNLYIITSGPTPPNPSELIGSKMMRELLNTISPFYDYIIIDSPPVLGISDGIILSTMADGVILVIKAGETPREAVQRSKKLLSDVNAKILGVVLNCVNLERPDYSYYYNYYYGYYDSDKHRKKRSSPKDPADRGNS
jgi:capsular exopolysaccharide synthesis family protein